MKLSKLILSAFVAVLALVSCKKQDAEPMVNGRLKTVEISLENLLFTKAETDAFLTADTKVNLSDFKIFLTDGTSIIEAGSFGSEVPVYYYSVAEGEALPKTATIHYVPAAVNKVVVVGNVGDAAWGNGITTYADLKNQPLDIIEEQDYKNLTLYGESGLVAAGEIHNHDDNKTYNLYTAEVELAPLVARFEVDGFAMIFNSDSPKYDKVEVKQIAINNYYTTTPLNPLAAASLNNSITEINDVNAFKFFDDNLSVEGAAAWYYDALPSGDVVLERANATGTPLAAIDDMATKKSYHFFPGAEVPQIFIELEVSATGESVGVPSYIYSKGFKKSDGSEVTFEPGFVYRMNFQGTAANGDGDLPFEEDDINELDKCLEIIVDVIKWQVVSVYPEF